MTDDGDCKYGGNRLSRGLRISGVLLILGAGAYYAYGRVIATQARDPSDRWPLEYQALLERARDWPLPDPDLSEVEPQVRELIQSLTESLVEDRPVANAWFALAQAYHSHEFLDSAVECYQRVLELNSISFPAQYLLAVALDQIGTKSDEAMAAFGKAIELEPDYPHSYYRMGSVHQRLGRLDEAADAFTLAAEKGLDFDMAFLALGRVQLELGDVDAALESLERSAELNPANGAVHTALARVHRRRGDVAAAAACAAFGARLDDQVEIPDPILSGVGNAAVSSLLVRRRSRTFLTKGAFDRALEDLLLCREINPDDGELLCDLGLCLRALGRDGEAEAALRASLEQSDAPPMSRWQLGLLQREQGRQAEGDEMIAQALSEWGDDPRFELDRAAALASAGREEEALATLARLPKRSVLAHKLAARILTTLGRDDEAIAEMEFAIELQPRDNELRGELVARLEALGRTAEAEDQRSRMVAPRSSLPE